MAQLVIRGGTVVNANGMQDADLLVENGKIAGIGHFASSEAVRALDARGLYVLPGLIDPHVHFDTPFMGTVTRHDFTSGTLAAAFGGVTTVIDFAFQEKGKPVVDEIRARMAQAEGRACVDYSFHAIFTDVKHETPRELPALLDLGIASWKVFMAYRRQGIMVDDGGLYGLLQATRDLPMMAIVHAENPFLIEYLIDSFLAQGKTTPPYHALSRPPLAEAEAVGRAARLAHAAAGAIYVFHVSSADALAEIRAARGKGWSVYAETCPHYLCLDASLYERADGHNWCMSPPLRGESDREALWHAATDGTISVISTDDAAFDAESKERGRTSFDTIPNGVPGVEPRLSILYSEGVAKGRFDLPRLVALTSTNPARITGLFPAKGHIAVGADADIVLFDPTHKETISNATSHMRGDWHPFEGMQVTGAPVMTIAHGEVIVENGEFIGREGAGKFVRRWVDPALKRGPML